MKLWKKILLLITALTMLFSINYLSSLYGFNSGIKAANNPSKMVELFKDEKVTFCDLDENARFYICPKVRRNLGKGATVYVCDNTNGFLLVKNLFEYKTQLVGKLIESGFRISPHCKNNTEEIFKMETGPWKTASTQ